MILLYDTATSDFYGGIPDDAPAVLFYVDGLYANERAARARFPEIFARRRALGLTVLGRRPEPGDDFEPGNWRGDAGQWVADCLAAGVWRPVVYADASDMYGAVIPELERRFGRPLGNPGPGRRFRLLLARPNGDPTIPSDMDGVQYWWGSIQGGGRVDMDISAVRDDFFPSTRTPPPPPEGTMSIALALNADGRLEAAVHLQDGTVKHTYQLEDKQHWYGEDPTGQNKAAEAQWRPLGSPGK